MGIKTDPLYSKRWHREVISTLLEDHTNRETARIVFGADSYESRIRRFLERLDVQRELADKKWHRSLPVVAQPMVRLANSPAKIVFIDLETTFNFGGHWNHWGTNIGIDAKLRDSHLLSYAAAWNDEDPFGEILNADVIQKDFIRSIIENDPFTTIDYDLVLKLWAILDNADVVVAQNGKAFDIKKINAYFLKFGLIKPSPYQVYDTLTVAKKMFNMSFKSLKFLAKYLGCTQKIDNSGADLWMKCSTGFSEDSLAEMMEYNLGDIITLREVYYKLLKYDNDNVNMALYYDDSESRCPTCGSDDIVSLGSHAHTNVRKYEAYRCNGCGNTLRSTKSTVYGNKFTVIASSR